MFIFRVDFVLKIEENLSLLALSWIEVNHKTKLCQRENSFILFIKYTKKMLLKGILLTCRRLQIFIELFRWPIS